MRPGIVAAFALAAALSAACTSTPDAAPASSSTAAPSTTTAAPSSTTSAPSSAARSARGLLVKQLGERAGIGNTPADARAWFTLERIEVDPKCDSATPAENGHMIALRFKVDTTALLDTSQHWFIAAQDFAVVGPDGVTDTNVSTGPGFGCLPDREYLPGSPYAPNSTYTGAVVLDSRYAAGTITYRPQVDLAGNGWEWAIPAR